jgi:hypothetical protein
VCVRDLSRTPPPQSLFSSNHCVGSDGLCVMVWAGVGLRPNVVFRTTPAVGHQDPPRDSVFLERHGAWVGLKPTCRRHPCTCLCSLADGSFVRLGKGPWNRLLVLGLTVIFFPTFMKGLETSGEQDKTDETRLRDRPTRRNRLVSR